MTKYGKTKKLMKETGISKKEAKDYLRRTGWDYEKAKQLWAISKLQEFDFEKIFDGLAQAVQKLIEELPDIIQEMVENLAPTIRKISEAAAAGCSKDEIRDRLGIASEEEGETNENRSNPSQDCMKRGEQVREWIKQGMKEADEWIKENGQNPYADILLKKGDDEK